MYKSIGVLALFAAFSCSPKASEETTEVMDLEPEWVSLFDGHSFDGWHVYNHPGEPISGKWSIQDSALVMNPEGESDWKVNDLVTDKEFENFELSLDWKIAEGGNSGIFYAVKEDSTLGTPYLSSPEIQVLDNDRHPDAKEGKDGNRLAGSLYDMIPAANRAKPAGEWNNVLIKKDNNHITVSQNGELAVEFTVGDEAWNELVAGSKFATWEAFAKNSSGLIGLQDHGNVVSFKNIKIKEL